MVVLPNAPWTVQLDLFGLNQGTKWQNRLHLTYPTGYGITTADLTSLCNATQTAWQTDIAPLCNTGVTLTAIRATDLNSRTGPVQQLTPTTPPAGTLAGTALSVQNALVSSWIIQNRYRGGHGRTYWPGGVQTAMVNGHLWTTAFVGTAQTAFVAFLAAMNNITVSSAHYVFSILSYYSGSHKLPGQPPPAPVLRPQPLPFPVTSVAVHQRIDTQRKRLGKEVP